MSAPPTAPDASAEPDPLQDRPQFGANRGASATPRVGRLLGVVRWIIGYGVELAAALQQRADPVRFAALGFHFQTSDLGAILARIARGLMLADMLETKLARLQGRGRDVKPADVRLPSTRRPRDPGAATAPKVRLGNIIDQPLDRLPSAEAIAAELRRRPIGAVLVDICRDLGILPGDLADGRWEELEHAIIEYGGNLVLLMFGCPLFDNAKAEARRVIAGKPPGEATEWVVPPLPAGAAMRPIDSLDDTRRPVAA